MGKDKEVKEKAVKEKAVKEKPVKEKPVKEKAAKEKPRRVKKSVSEEIKRERRYNMQKEIKAIIPPLVFIGVVAILIVGIMIFQDRSKHVNAVPVRSYEGDDCLYVLENDELRFEMDALTTNFDLTVKSTGKVWHSTPEGAASDSIAISEEKNKLQSSFLLTYGTQGGLETTFNTFGFSVPNKIYEIEAGPDYIRVDYSLGKVRKEYVVPPVIRAERFEELRSKMSVTDADSVKGFYKKYDIEDLGKNDDKDQLLLDYPILEKEVIYVLRPSLKDSAYKSIEKNMGNAGYTYEEFVLDKELDHKVKEETNPVFNASVIYRLDGKDLLVEVPFDSLDSWQEYPIYTICPLPYFGAGGIEDEGFLFVPEGGGSILNFNNGKNKQTTYVSNLYGWDQGLSRDELVHETEANMNVYGVSNQSDSFICIIESGSSYATIKADVSGRTNQFNYVNAEYSIKPKQAYDMGTQANTAIYVYLEDLPKDEAIVERFSFVDSGSYVDMAKAYRTYLENRYSGYFTRNNDKSTPVAFEVVGAVDKVKQIVGVPVSRPLPLTTYKEAAEMLADAGNSIDNLFFKYTGWCNGGVKQKILKHVNNIGSLGSMSDIRKLSNQAKEDGVSLYLDGISMFEYNSTIFNGFLSYRDAARFLSRERAKLHIFSDVTYAEREGTKPYYLLHTDLGLKLADKFTDFTAKYGTGTSFNDIGDALASDFYRKKYSSREYQLNEHVKILKDTVDNGGKVMINAGNAYAMPYADYITNMDLRGSEYTILDEVIPFYQIAIHGYVDYSGQPINTSGDTEEAILDAAAYGAGLSFSLMKESPFTLQKTLYTEYYASDYDVWKDKILDIYNRFNSELGHTYGQTIEDFERLSADVSKTVYADGTEVYVNYGYYDFDASGITIPARDYKVVR